MATTTETGSLWLDRVTMFLSLMDPVVPFPAEADDPAARWDAAAVAGTAVAGTAVPGTTGDRAADPS